MSRARAALWTLRAVRRARRDLRRGVPVDRVALPAPPPAPRAAGSGVLAVLGHLDPSCLERSLVLQRWLAAHGEARDVVIGVTGADAFRAHAWLEGEEGPGFHEIARVAP
jgi:hypothetical protein